MSGDFKAATAVAPPAIAKPEPPLNAADSDPVKMGWMVGSPPPADKLILFSNMTHYRFPQSRWSFANIRRFMPSSNISRGGEPSNALSYAERKDIDTLTFQPLGSADKMSWAQSLEANYTDAIVVLHRGRVVHERYFGVMSPHATHMAMSVTKSFFGTLGAMLVAEGGLDDNAPVPELSPNSPTRPTATPPCARSWI